MAKLNTQKVTTAILAIVLIVVLFKTYAVIVPEAQGAGDELGNEARCDAAGGYWNTTLDDCRNQTGAPSESYEYTAVPLGGMFSGNGIVFLIIMAALVFVVIKSFKGDMK